MPSAGLYIHIPFCHARCSYCDFVTFTDAEDQIDSYLAALIQEIRRYRGKSIETIFIGGGTPTVLNPSQVSMLFRSIHAELNTSGIVEATVEANPESACNDVLTAYKDGGVNRLSFGLQTTNSALLKQLERLHSRQQFFDAFARARALRFLNINVDLIYGLPGQTLEDWGATLKEVAGLEPEHISLYGLKVEAGTKMAKQGVVVDDDLEAAMYLEASDFLCSKGFVHYEISNFSRPGFESRHNMRYWNNEDTVGLGVSATSYLSGKRFKNATRLPEYIGAMKEGRPSTIEEWSHPARTSYRETLMLKLRTNRGVAESEIRALDLPVVNEFLTYGLATVEGGTFLLTPRGWLVSNQLFQHLV